MIDPIRWLIGKVNWMENIIHYWDHTPTHYLCLSVYDASPARSTRSDIHGAFQLLSAGDTLSSGSPINITKGPGKIVFYVNAGTDLVGSMTITGTKVDRETGAETGSYAESITLNGLTTISNTTDANGNVVYTSSNGYITSSWFSGAVTISTTNLNLSDIDVLGISFEQFNDVRHVTVETLDATIYTTNIAAEFDCYLYTIEVSPGNICAVDNISSLHVGAVGTTALANKYYRLRRGNIFKKLNCKTDGIFMEVIYSNSPAYVEDVNIKVWVR